MPRRRLHSSPAAREEQELALRRVGAELRGARLARGEDLGDIAAYLRIRPSFLAALEAGEMGATPGRPYALGFLRSYAEHLGMDPDRLVAPLKAVAEPIALGRRSVPRETRRPAVVLLAVPVLLLIAVTIGYRYDQVARDELPAPIADGPAPLLSARPAAEPAAFEPGTQGADVTAALAAEAATPAVLESADRETASVPDLAARGGRLVLVARANGWIRLRSADREIVRSGALATGDRVVVPDRQDLRLSTGNAGDVEILLDGRNIGPLGAPGEVVRDLAMDPDALASRLASPH